MVMALGFSSFTATQNQTQPENAFDGLVPDFSAPKSSKLWHIFINHHGGDVKHTLATTIYQNLSSLKFSVFLDKDALEAGDYFPAEIQNAIATASLHIAIFSPNYPHSPWCLTELSLMLKTGKKVIPIFYNVDPSDLRLIKKGKGKYAHIFSEHEKKSRYTLNQLDEWKEALYNCSNIHGHVLNNEKDEAKILESIVNDVLKINGEKGLLSVAEHPVGLGEFESVARDETVKIRGLVGMRGSFVSDVRDAASRNALPDEHKKLLKDLGVVSDADLHFHHVDEGKFILENRLSGRSALIVLDNVDHLRDMGRDIATRHSPYLLQCAEQIDKMKKLSKKIVLRLTLEDDKSKRKVLKVVAAVEGVDSVAVDMKERKITVIGEADPVYVTARLRKFGFGFAQLQSVGPAKEEKIEKNPTFVDVQRPSYHNDDYSFANDENPNACTIS